MRDTCTGHFEVLNPHIKPVLSVYLNILGYFFTLSAFLRIVTMIAMTIVGYNNDENALFFSEVHMIWSLSIMNESLDVFVN